MIVLADARNQLKTAAQVKAFLLDLHSLLVEGRHLLSELPQDGLGVDAVLQMIDAAQTEVVDEMEAILERENILHAGLTTAMRADR